MKLNGILLCVFGGIKSALVNPEHEGVLIIIVHQHILESPFESVLKLSRFSRETRIIRRHRDTLLASPGKDILPGYRSPHLSRKRVKIFFDKIQKTPLVSFFLNPLTQGIPLRLRSFLIPQFCDCFRELSHLPF
ncbi:MAG: hypothetical protein BWY44_00249 [Candidatus Omnitrophica bacterium ADurb.Bin292]|nr:MAG: hypothetical protein BWY44_00249 [Candidatus Omnitrophica bacterium ADurb.Bin292]